MSDTRLTEIQQTIDPYYLEQKQREAIEVDSGNKKYVRNLHIVDLQPVNPSMYYDSLKDWHEMEAFKEPKKKYANQDAGISWGLRIKALFSSDAEQELNRKKTQADEMHNESVQRAFDAYNRRAKRFYGERKKQHLEIDALHQEMKNGNVAQIQSYFTFALQQDRFSTDFLTDFHIDIADVLYDAKSHKLSFAYRVPLKEEILTFSTFKYNQDQDAILPTPIEAKYQLVQRTHVYQRILVRALIMAFASDTYGFVNDVEITGFLEYHDPSYGIIRRKDVVNFHMSRDDFNQTDFERVDVEALFKSRLRPKESAGLYIKEPSDVSDIYTAKVKGTVSTKA